VAVDVAIHVMSAEITCDTLKAFYNNKLGHKWYNTYDMSTIDSGLIRGLIEESPQVWIGEASFLDAAVYDADDAIPRTVMDVCHLIDDGVTVIDDSFLFDVQEVMDYPNTSKYPVAISRDVLEFLQQYKGMKVFIALW
jgi:hypothetical protein